MPKVYLSLGSNIDRTRNITGALDAISTQFGTMEISSIYESEAVGFDGDNFYNLVVGIESDLPVGELASTFRKIEADYGRQRGEEKFSARTLDIDILTYGDAVGFIDGVELPRDEINKYAFVILPMVELAPAEAVPGKAMSYQQLLNSLDLSLQSLWTVPFEWQGHALPCSIAA